MNIFEAIANDGLSNSHFTHTLAQSQNSWKEFKRVTKDFVDLPNPEK